MGTTQVRGPCNSPSSRRRSHQTTSVKGRGAQANPLFTAIFVPSLLVLDSPECLSLEAFDLLKSSREQNTLPCLSGFGRYPISPPMSSARDLEMDNPRPMPRWRFLVSSSNCVNGL